MAANNAELFAAALHDELHEPYRGKFAPVLDDVRAELPAGAVGATISGSGPTVIVWTRAEQRDDCRRELGARFADALVLPLDVSPLGVHRA
jgi:homoserine kinase